MRNALLWSLALCAVSAEPMKPGDRQRLLEHLQMSTRWTEDEVRGLSAKQLSFRPSPEAWSILDILEHLNLAEPQYEATFREALLQEPAGKPGEAQDAAILWYGVDRSQRNKTGEARTSKGALKHASQGLAEFRNRREALIEFVRTTDRDLRMWRLPKSSMDAYQAVLMISAHGQRHILQIREIKSHAEFPR